MGSSFSQQLCCVLCERCRRREGDAANGESSETKPILHTPGATATFLDTQPPTPALKVPRQGSKGLQVLVQDRRPSADALEENGETCSAAGRAEGWEAAWNPMDLCVTPAEEVEGEAEDLIQADEQREEVKNTEEEIKSVPEAQAEGAELVAEQEQPQGPGQPGMEGAGITLQQGNILTLLQILSEAEPGQGCEMEPPAAPGDGGELSLCAVQVAAEPEPCPAAGEGTARAGPAEMSPQGAHGVELSWLLEAVSLLTVQNPPGLTAGAVPEPWPTPAVPWQSLCPQWGPAEPPEQQCALEQGLQGALGPALAMGSLCWAGPSELLQAGAGALRELGQEGSAACAAEPRARIPQQTPQLPEEPRAPELPEEPHAPELPEEPRAPELSEKPRAPELPEKPRAPELPEEPCAPELPQKTHAPELPKKPRAPELPNVPPSLPEGRGSSGEMEAEDAEA